MSAIYLLIPLSLVIAGGFLAAFIWAVRSGQYEDTQTPALRILAEEGRPERGLGARAEGAGTKTLAKQQEPLNHT